MRHRIALLLVASSIMLFCMISLNACFIAKAVLVNTQELDTTNVESIFIRYSTENISFHESDNEMLVVKEYISEEDPIYHASITLQDNAISVQTGQRFDDDPFESYVEIYLPLSFTKELKIETTSGLVRIGGSYVLNSLSISTTTGNIQISNLESKAISCNTTSGRIDITDGIGALDCSTQTGSILLKSFDGHGQFSTRSGACNLQFVNMDGAIDASTTSGKLSLAMPKDIPFRFVARTISGHITAPFDEGPATNLTASFIEEGQAALDAMGEAGLEYITFEANNGIAPKTIIHLSTQTGRIAVSNL